MRNLIPALSTSLILGPIALAGTGSGPGIGRAAVTSRRGFGSHVSEGVRQAGVPKVLAKMPGRMGSGSSARQLAP